MLRYMNKDLMGMNKDKFTWNGPMTVAFYLMERF